MHPLGARTREDMKERIMDRTQYTNLAKAWEFTEEHARERESDALTDTRTAADESGQLQGSAAQARLLGMLVRITGAASVIAVGTGSLVETLQLAHALDNKGLLTAVDSTAQGIALIRKAFAELQDETDTTLRAVNAPASVFLPRLNANDYDLIVVAGDAENYAATFAQASRLLRVHGVIVFTDVLALEDGQGGVINPADRSDKAIAMRELLTTVEDDEGFESTLTPDGTGLLIAYKKYLCPWLPSERGATLSRLPHNCADGHVHGFVGVIGYGDQFRVDRRDHAMLGHRTVEPVKEPLPVFLAVEHHRNIRHLVGLDQGQ